LEHVRSAKIFAVEERPPDPFLDCHKAGHSPAGEDGRLMDHRGMSPTAAYDDDDLLGQTAALASRLG